PGAAYTLGGYPTKAEATDATIALST
ncbi:hypothetical protein LCGC14_2283060, partial [marine sediment metagenome]